MKPTLLICALSLLTVSAAGQNPTQPQPWDTTTIAVHMLNPPVPPSGVTIGFTGAPGSSANTVYYWLVSNFLVGNSTVSQGFPGYNAPTTLSSSNFFTVYWQPVAGALSYDLLRTSTPTPPSGACNCAVATGISGTTRTDQSNSLSSYTVTTFDPNSALIQLESRAIGAGAANVRFRMKSPGIGVLNVVGIATPAVGGNCPQYASNGIDLIDSGNTNCGGGGGGGTSALPINTGQISGAAGAFTSDNIRKVNASNYAWTQSPAGSLSATVQATVTLTPCPPGIAGTFTWSYVWIAGTGTPEAVLIQGGTCVGKAASGTIVFTPANNHGAGFTLSSPTQGWQEASNDAMFTVTNPSGVSQSGEVIGAPGEYVWTARMSVMSTQQTLRFDGTIIGCNMSDACLFVGSPLSFPAVSDVKVFNFRGRPMVNAGQFPMIEDNGNASLIDGVTTRNGLSGGTFGYDVQIDGDENAHIAHVDPSIGSPNIKCTSSFCGSVIYAPGPFASNAAVGYITHSNLTLNCGANGIDWQSGNTLHVQDTIVQGQHAFGIRTGVAHGGFGGTLLTNVYQENGSCGNSVGTAGVIVQGNTLTIRGGEGPQGTFPVFNSGAGANRQYFIVAHDSVFGPSVPLPIGSGTPTSGTVTVLWPQIPGTNVTTYDLLVTTGAVPFGTALQAVHGAVGISGSCANSICTAADVFATALDSYTVAEGTLVTYFPLLNFWPGAIVLSSPVDSSTNQGFAGVAHADLDSTVSYIVSETAEAPTVSARQCDATTQLNSLWVDCPESTSSGYNSQNAATMFEMSSSNSDTSQTGRIGFGSNRNTILGPNHFITLLDSCPICTMRNPKMRRTFLPADTFLGTDTVGGHDPAFTALAVGNPIAISNYIGSNPDNTSWKERLTATLKTFKVPISLISAPPTTASDPCVTGTETWDANFIYQCVATDTWKRTAITTW